MSLWNLFLKQPLANLLFFFYQSMGNNLGLAIIATAVAVGLAMIPLMLPSLRSAQLMQLIKPELDQLNKKYSHDKKLLATKQLELYQKHKINPASGILPVIFRLMVVIALYQVLNLVISGNGSIKELNQLLYPFISLPADTILNTRFLYLDVLGQDTFALPFELNLIFFKVSALPGLFLLGSAVLQYLQTVYMKKTSAPQKTIANPNISSSKDKPDQAEMAETMQKQMAIMMPIMTLLIGYRLASGLILSWFTFSLIAIFQQLYTSKLIKKPTKQN